MPKPYSNHLVSGDALSPQPSDIIAAFATITVDQPVPEGWRILSGNNLVSTVAFIGYRYELEIA